jgi:hypothetical protein
MNTYLLWVTTSLALVSLSFQAFSCEPPPVPEPPPSASSPSPQTPESGVGPEESSQSLIPEPLPRLSAAEIESLQTELTHSINTWFSLAGVSKVLPPPPLTDTLQDYREAWRAVNPDVAHFLGSWIDSEGYSYSVTLFPSRTPGQVCVLEFRPKWSLSILNEVTGESVEDVMSEQLLSFSVATVQDGHLRSDRVRSVNSVTTVETYGVGEAYPVAFMALMKDQDTRRAVALSSPPALPSELPEALMESVSQTLSTHGCITDLVPGGQ